LLKTIISHRYSPAHLFILLLLIQIWDPQTLIAQNYLTTFGQVTSFRTGSHPRHIAAGDFNGDGKNNLAILFEDHIAFKYRDSSGFRTSNLNIEGEIEEVIPVRLHGD